MWNVIAFYEHVWNARWKTSLFGGYVKVDYNADATRLINPVAVCAGTGAGFAGFVPLLGNSCNPDFDFYQIGTRTQWNPTPLLDIGLEVLYTKLNTAYKGPAWITRSPAKPGAPGRRPGVWSTFFRWQRNFYP